MTSERESTTHKADAAGVAMPEATAWPFVLSLGVTLLAAGIATHWVLSLVGLILFVIALAGWVSQLLPGRGHVHETLASPDQRPRPIAGRPGTVAQLRPGMPGFRFRLPEKIHPISAGVKGGIVGGLVMPIPALAYGLLSRHGLWFPINLLSGMMLPSADDLTVAQLEAFNLTALLLGCVIHACLSVGIGLLYGVLLPTLPSGRVGPLFWGGVIMPLLWTGICYGLMGIVNPVLQEHVDWFWFLLSQLVFGVAAAIVVIRSEQIAVAPLGERAPE